MTRPRTALLLAVLLLGTTSCFGGGDEPGRAEPAKGCDPCQAEVADVRKALEAVPQVTAVTRVQYAPEKNITRSATLSIDLEIKAGAVDPARLAALKAAWLSEVTPLDSVLVAMVTPDGEVTTQDGRFYEKSETKVYEAKWGPRPVD